MTRTARLGVLAGLFAVLMAALLIVRLATASEEPAVAAPAVSPAPAATAGAAAPAPAQAAPTAMKPAAPTAPAAAPAATAAPAAKPAAQPPEPAAAGDTTVAFDITTRAARPVFTAKDTYISWMLERTDQKEKFLGQRWDRMQAIIAQGHVRGQKTIDAFLATPRELFSRDLNRAYDDAALPIGFGQTISGPHMVAHMTDYLNVQPSSRVLEIGTGSGYQAAVLSQLSNHVYTIEIVKELAASTDLIYRSLLSTFPEYRNVRRKMADGYYGWKEYAPFDRIIVTCGIDHIPPSLLEQLTPEGIMLIPVGPPAGQTLLRILKHVAADGSVTLERDDIFQGRHKPTFVPFTGGGGGKATQ